MMNFIDALKRFLSGDSQQELQSLSPLIESKRQEIGSYTDGTMTETRPENYFGGAFVPEGDPRFNGVEMPTRENLGYLEDNILGQTREAGIPDAIPASQWANEGGRNTAPEGNNPFGLGPGNEYASMAESTQVYINTVLNNSGLGEKGEDGKLKLKKGVTAEQLLDALAGKYEMHMEDTNAYGRSLKETPEWRFYQDK